MISYIESVFSRSGSKLFILLFFIILSLLYWSNPNTFFLADDWHWIIDYIDGKPFKSYALKERDGNLYTLSQLVYNWELFLFGKNAFCFQILITIFWGITVFIFYLIALKITSNESISYLTLLLAATFIMHSFCGHLILWIFSQNIILQFIFQGLTVLLYFKFLQKESNKNLLLFCIFLFLQNFFSVNGKLFPILFIGHYVWRYKFEKKGAVIGKFLLTTVLIQVLFLVIQRLTSSQVTVGGVLRSLHYILIAYFMLLAHGVARFFYLSKLLSGSLIYLSLIILAGLFFLAYKKSKNGAIFLFLYLIAVTLSVPIGRWHHILFKYRYVFTSYSFFMFPVIFMLFMIIFKDLSVNVKRILGVILSLCAIFFFFDGLRLKRTYSIWHTKNKEALYTAIKYNKNHYYPFNDQVITQGTILYLDHVTNETIQKSLMKSSYFGADSAIIQYMGEDRYNKFLNFSSKVIQSYKKLSERSLFDLDVPFEKETYGY